MATKIKMLKLLQEWNGIAEIGRRRPLPKPHALYLTRSQALQAAQTKRRLVIRINPKDHANIPSPVKIIHIKAPAAGSAQAPDA